MSPSNLARSRAKFWPIAFHATLQGTPYKACCQNFQHALLSCCKESLPKLAEKCSHSPEEPAATELATAACTATLYSIHVVDVGGGAPMEKHPLHAWQKQSGAVRDTSSLLIAQRPCGASQGEAVPTRNGLRPGLAQLSGKPSRLARNSVTTLTLGTGGHWWLGCSVQLCFETPET